jgi:hypothetical protein
VPELFAAIQSSCESVGKLLFGGLSKKSSPLLLKGTVSPDITFYFRFCKIKSVLSVRPLRVFKFLNFVVL